MAVHAYTRLSQNRNGTRVGHETQRAKIESYCAANELSVDAWHVETETAWAPTGTSTRPVFKKLLAELAPGDTLVAHRLDRLTRSQRDLIELRDLDSTGVRVLTAEGDLDLTSASGRIMALISTEIAYSEVETTRQRIKAQHATLKRAGRWTGNQRAFGYSDDSATRTIREAEHAALKHVYTMLTARDATWADAAKYLNDQGFATTRQTPWTARNLSKFFTSPQIYGVMNQTLDGVTREVKAPWEPLFTRTEQAVIEALRAERRKINQTTGELVTSTPRHFVTGSVTCARCEVPMIVQGRRLRCKECQQSIVRAPVEEAIEKMLLLKLRDHWTPQTTSGVEPLNVSDEEAKISRYKELFESGSIPEEMYSFGVQQETDKITAKRKAWELKAEQQLPAWLTGDSDLLMKRWETMSALEKRQLVKIMFPKLRLEPTGLPSSGGARTTDIRRLSGLE